MGENCVLALSKPLVNAGIKIRECWAGCDASAAESKRLTWLWGVSAASQQSPRQSFHSGIIPGSQKGSHTSSWEAEMLRTNVFTGVTWGGGAVSVFWLCLRRKINYIFSLEGQTLCRGFTEQVSVLSLSNIVHTLLEFLICCLPER